MPPFEDESELMGDNEAEAREPEEEDGEELFGDAMERYTGPMMTILTCIVL